jgi:hypothetical protein
VADRFQLAHHWQNPRTKGHDYYHEAKKYSTGNILQAKKDIMNLKKRKILGLVISTIEVEEHQARAEKLN